MSAADKERESCFVLPRISEAIDGSFSSGASRPPILLPPLTRLDATRTGDELRGPSQRPASHSDHRFQESLPPLPASATYPPRSTSCPCLVSLGDSGPCSCRSCTFKSESGHSSSSSHPPLPCGGQQQAFALDLRGMVASSSSTANSFLPRSSSIKHNDSLNTLGQVSPRSPNTTPDTSPRGDFPSPSSSSSSSTSTPSSTQITTLLASLRRSCSLNNNNNSSSPDAAFRVPQPPTHQPHITYPSESFRNGYFPYPSPSTTLSGSAPPATTTNTPFSSFSIAKSSAPSSSSHSFTFTSPSALNEVFSREAKSKKRKRSEDDDDMDPRARHNLAEQKRRNRLRDSFDKLKTILPNGDDKMTKVALLNQTYDYIQVLQDLSNNLLSENMKIREKLNYFQNAPSGPNMQA